MLIRVRGRSMIPTLRPGDWLWAVPSSTRARRGDLFFIERRSPPEGRFVKRLVGLPGETVELRRSRAVIDGRSLEEPYVAPDAFLEPQPDGRWVLGEGDYFVMGDARDDSLDSRKFGPVPRDFLAARIRARLWPLPVRFF